MEKIDKGIVWLERIMTMIEKYSIFQFFKGFFIILFTCILVWFVTNPTYIFERYEEWQRQAHSEKLEMRMKNNGKLQLMAEKLLYKIGADRVMILELHNGLSSNSGFPFAKCSATYEALNKGITPIANQYQDVNLSLVPFASELFSHTYWCGNVKDLESIDRGLTYKMLSNGTEHFAGCVIKGVDKPLAFIFVSFNEIPEHQCNDVKNIIKSSTLELALLLELKKDQ